MDLKALRSFLSSKDKPKEVDLEDTPTESLEHCISNDRLQLEYLCTIFAKLIKIFFASILSHSSDDNYAVVPFVRNCKFSKKKKLANTITTWAMFASVMTQVLAQQDDQFCRFSATTKVLQRGRRNQNLGNSQRNNNFAKRRA